ncbi:MAG: hypothetical protein ACI30A_03340 [Paludibacteraceae bacterium]
MSIYFCTFAARNDIRSFAAVFCLAGFSKPAKTSESYEHQRAVELMDQYQYKEGIEWMDKELKNNPKNSYAHVWMTVAYANLEEYGKAMTAIYRKGRFLC